MKRNALTSRRAMLSQRFLEDMLTVWNETNEDGNQTGIAAIRLVAATNPSSVHLGDGQACRRHGGRQGRLNVPKKAPRTIASKPKPKAGAASPSRKSAETAKPDKPKKAKHAGKRLPSPLRSHLYTQELADEICRRLAEGESLRSIARTPGFPSRKQNSRMVFGCGASLLRRSTHAHAPPVTKKWPTKSLKLRTTQTATSSNAQTEF